MSTATVSVAIPVFNGESSLERSLTSVLRQTRPPDEVLVFDNASTDRTVEIASRLLGVDGVRGSIQNLGAGHNFNRAARESRGAYFAWLAADDELDPRYVEVTLSALAADPEAAVCVTGYELVSDTGVTLGVHLDTALSSDSPGTRFRSFLRRELWLEVYGLYRRDRLLASPLSARSYAADVHLTWWFLLRGPFVVVSEPLMRYTVRTQPMSVPDVQESVAPGSVPNPWRNAGAWASLWALTRDEEISPATRWVARKELVLAVFHRDWAKHLVNDLRYVSPRLWRQLRFVYRQARRLTRRQSA